jgi:hypothetical protein
MALTEMDHSRVTVFRDSAAKKVYKTVNPAESGLTVISYEISNTDLSVIKNQKVYFNQPIRL